MGELDGSYDAISTIRTVCGVVGALLGGCVGLAGGVIGALIGGAIGFALFRFLLGSLFGALFTTGIGHIIIAFIAIVPVWFFYKWRMKKWNASTAALAWPPILTAVAIFIVMFLGADNLLRMGLQRLGLTGREVVVEEPPVVTVTVTSAAANIRSAPDSTKDNVITQMKKGDTLIAAGAVNNGWLPVEIDGQAGYVSASLVSMENIVFQSGVSYLNQEDYDAALREFNETIRLNPNNASAYAYRGRAYQRRGNYDQAIADCDKAISLNPNDPMAYFARGSSYYGKENYGQAISDLTQSINLDPHNSNAYNNRGISHLNNGDVDQAIDDYKQALRIDPKNSTAKDNLDNALAWKKLNKTGSP
ncbi:MAG: tetratricopeptide repeat protein [Treponema sp.]|nr:tetratricopeptide repeat protein [Treponema sp.]